MVFMNFWNIKHYGAREKILHMTSRTTERCCPWKHQPLYSLCTQKSRPAPELEEQQEATTHSGSEFENQTLMKEAILLICDSTGRSEISTHCSDDGKIAVLAATREIYPKFHSCLCYYIYKLPSKEVNPMLSHK